MFSRSELPPSPAAPSRHRRRLTALALALALFAGACTTDSETAEEPSNSIRAGGRTAVDGLVALCESALTADPPAVDRLALDPATTGQIVSIPDDLVTTAVAEFLDCLGPENAATYVTTRFIVTGLPLPEGTDDCLLPSIEADGPAVLETSLRRTRLETPSADLVDAFTEALLPCVPGRYLAAALKSVNAFGYASAVDEACLDAAQEADDSAMRIFWRLQLTGTGEPDPSAISDQETAVIVAPLYDCIDTGSFIASDPSTGTSLSRSSRACITESAARHGYWESRLAAREFDTAAYEAEITDCLTPEEALVIFGTPIPVDDPVTSKFAVVDECWAAAPEAEGRTLREALAESSDAELTTIASRLSACAGPDGVAGRLASTAFGSRNLPAGSYECFRPLTQTDPASILTGRLFVEADRVPTRAAGESYLRAADACIPISLSSRPLFVDFTSPRIFDTIDFVCVADAYDAAPGAGEAYWQGTVFGGFAEGDGPSPLARQAVAPLYGCVDVGQGVADAAGVSGVTLSQSTQECINTGIAGTEVLERRLAGLDFAAATFNGAIAECLSPEEVEALRS